MASEGDWRNVFLQDLAAQSRNALVGGPFGSDLVSSDYAPSGVPVIRGENLSFGRWVGGEFVFVSPAKATSLAANTAGPLDVIFTQRGANHYRQVAVVPRDASRRFVISQSQMKLTVDQNKADPLFIYYLFRTPAQQEHLQRNAIQTGVPHTNLSILRKVPLRVPSLRTQREIVRILGTLDDKIELNQKMSETLEAITRVLFKSWFVGFDPVRAKAEGRPIGGVESRVADLFSDSFEKSELGLIPTGWNVKSIGDLATIVGGSTPSTKESVFWEYGNNHWATPKDLSGLCTPVLLDTERKITDRGLAQIGSGLLPVGTVLLSSRAPIGYLAMAEVPVAINQGFIAMLPKEGIPNLFLLRWAEWAHDEIVSRANGSTFPEISKANFRPIPVVVPPGPVLEAFEQIARPIYARIVSNERESRTLVALRDALLPKLISGELRIDDAGRFVGGQGNGR
jgi:type I restriction enzyme S subunit